MGGICANKSNSSSENLEGYKLSCKKAGSLIEHAKKHNARNEVLQDLDKIPDKEYTNAADVSKESEGE